jgi:hypothetical protein
MICEVLNVERFLLKICVSSSTKNI